MPIYETPEDRAIAAEVAGRLVGPGRLEAVCEMPLMYTLDYAGLRGDKVYRFIEIKSRNCLFGAFEGGLFLSANKLAFAKLLTDATGIETMLVVRFADGEVYWCRISDWDRERGVFIWGAADRDDDGPSVAYPWSVFRRLAA